MAETKPIATITSQVEYTGAGADGQIQAGYRVAFQTAKGVVGTVFIARAAYNKEAVLAAVKDAALMMDSVQGAEVV